MLLAQAASEGVTNWPQAVVLITGIICGTIILVSLFR